MKTAALLVRKSVPAEKGKSNRKVFSRASRSNIQNGCKKASLTDLKTTGKIPKSSSDWVSKFGDNHGEHKKVVFHHERSLTPIEYTKANSNLPATESTVKMELNARKTDKMQCTKWMGL